MILARRLRSAADAHKADRGSKLVVILSIWVGISAGFIASEVFPRFTIGNGWKSIFVLGIGMWLFGVAFRMYSIRVLGRFFTYDVAISREQHVVEAGPYRWVRHPSYLGGLLALFGFGMTMTNWAAMLLPAFCSAVGYSYRIPIEERALVRGLGDEYREYMKRTWRLVPYVF
ncbi:MAG TPA: isoprenylcysteine carboxylmethyltransferase family protein [Acidobacteriaceae bacterium]|nr:isoprenylcysteine carboxylmethyltransferase family protein [Acidobacteriaceae bacterium]